MNQKHKNNVNYNNFFLRNLILKLIKKGNYRKAHKLGINLIKNLRNLTGISGNFLLYGAIFKVMPLLEIKSINKGRSRVIIPKLISLERSFNLSFLNLINNAKKVSGKNSKLFIKSLNNEILNSFNGKSNTINENNKNYKLAKQNKMKIYFRWS